MVIIKSPHTMTSSRLKHVLYLYCSHKSDILIEYLSNKTLQLIIIAKSQFIERPTKKHEWHLMTSSIIYSDIASPWLIDISTELLLSTFDTGWKNLIDKGFCIAACFLIPIFKCYVTVSHWLLDWWSLFKEFMQFSKIWLEYPKFCYFGCCTDRFTLYWLQLIDEYTYWSFPKNFKY
jgi:hypothetical protein